ncbi:DUF1205 domain-containing protein [Crossiella sp. SN42]|uniref:nucleotide disphospho-sugar-binding domain-containing protein n=1 Tax=Crossiella sp. SN42 TaxID=2944808 RepID=UPI00207D50C0|nr:nucleotide disphospho-sugar-binding domain-containing protein [Crossiella sp. SN42]MCO1580318.1 DUF1205 domain-containing protein [Crossiella sp. SN42]
MRVLFTTWAWRSHYNPLVPLGHALRAAGHEVMVASHPSFADSITAAGLPALPAGPEVDLPEVLSAAIRTSTWRPSPGALPQADNPLRRRKGLTVLRLAADSATAMAGDTRRFAESWRPDLVVYEPMGFLGPVLARAMGIPSLRQLWTVDFLADIPEVEQEILGELAASLGADTPNALGDRTLDPCPPSLRGPGDYERQPIRFVPYNGPAVLPHWLRTPPRRPRVCVTWGTSIDGMGLNDYFLAPQVVQALAEREVEVVVAVVNGQRELFGDLPPNVVHLGPVPLDLLLPSCVAVVHQGGGGTTMTAMKAGIPQFVLPYLPDTTFNARHIAATGAARWVWGGTADASVLRAELAEFLDGLAGYRAGAERLHAEHLAQPSPAEVVSVLERAG